MFCSTTLNTFELERVALASIKYGMQANAIFSRDVAVNTMLRHHNFGETVFAETS